MRPVPLLTTGFFYPVGNTPAVCLTRSLPPDQDVSLLLLGCGDARNLLFTTYADLGSGRRKVDATCCDIETEIIARNVILYTLILDDTNDKNVKDIWNLYNDVLVNKAALDLLRAQAKMLIENGNTLEDWNDGKYGKVLRFCNRATFSQAMRLWEFYALDPSTPQEFKQQQKRLELGIKKAKALQKEFVGDTGVITGMRSAAPCGLESAAADCFEIYKDFWKEGVVMRGMGSANKAQHMNPMFGTLSGNLVLHYGTQPLLGYHLATAYTPITKKSPLNYDLVDLGDTRPAIKAAFAQFSSYAKAFRAVSSHWVIRFVNADALVFCHTLQGLEEHNKSTGLGLYRDSWHYEPFLLDSPDYFTQGAGAPRLYDMIDTSNLADHLGGLNMLVAAGPLLKPKSTSTVYTELLAQRHDTTDQTVKTLLSGDMVTVGLLFKLTPIQYWTGTTVSSNLVDRVVGSDKISGRGKFAGRQSRYIVRWATINTTPTIFEPKQLSDLMYRMYLDMFGDEDPMHVINAMTTHQGNAFQFPQYTRASLCLILRMIQKSNIVDWDTFMREYRKSIEQNTSLLMGAHYLQALYLHLHLSGLHTMPSFEPDMDGIAANLPLSPFRSWSNIPSVLCLTLLVPHGKLATVYKSPKKYGTLAPHILLESQLGQSYFPDIQLSFGQIRQSGEKFTSNHALEFTPDDKGWDGKMPLVVSVMIPTSLVLMFPSLSTQVSFALKTTAAALKLVGQLGTDLKIHQSTLASNDVYITRCFPNMNDYASIKNQEDTSVQQENMPLGKLNAPLSDETEVKFYVSLDSKQSKVISLTTRIDIKASRCQEILREGTEVCVKQETPYNIILHFGEAFSQNIGLPLPVSVTNAKTRVARKSSYVEFIAAIDSPESTSKRPDGVFPVGLLEYHPILRNLDYTALDSLPILDLKNNSQPTWLNPLVSDMFSDRERKERNKYLSSTINCRDARVNFKDSLHSLFGYFDPKTCTVFSLCNNSNGGVHVVLLISCLRLDISNQSVVLDGAALPLTTRLVPKIEPMLRYLTTHGTRIINVDDDELLLWKHVLPAFIERCRTWTHLPSCEYKSVGKVPLSVSFGQPFLCSCGKGRFPKDYKVDEFPFWNDVKKHAVRIAISPCYSVPFVEKSVAFDDLGAEKPSQDPGQMPKPLSPAGRCSSCGKKGSENQVKLLKCAGCKVAEYCSKECQKMDWQKKHKQICKNLKQLN